MKKPDTPKQPDYDELDTILLELAQGSPDHKVSRTEQLLTARGAIHAHYQAKIREAIGEDEEQVIGEQGKYDPKTRTHELIVDSEPVKYHIQRTVNRNEFKAELRQSLLGGEE